MSPQRSWYLIHTKSRMEKKAEENLNRQGYDTYLPMMKSTRRRNGKYIAVTEAFFPRYLFIQLNTETDNWSPIRSTLGVSGLIRFGGMPAVVPGQLVDELQKNENEHGLQQFYREKLMHGDNVTIINGPFTGRQGIYQQKKGAERVAILLNVVGGGGGTQVILNEREILLDRQRLI